MKTELCKTELCKTELCPSNDHSGSRATHFI